MHYTSVQPAPTYFWARGANPHTLAPAPPTQIHSGFSLTQTDHRSSRSPPGSPMGPRNDFNSFARHRGVGSGLSDKGSTHNPHPHPPFSSLTPGHSRSHKNTDTHKQSYIHMYTHTHTQRPSGQPYGDAERLQQLCAAPRGGFRPVRQGQHTQRQGEKEGAREHASVFPHGAL